MGDSTLCLVSVATGVHFERERGVRVGVYVFALLHTETVGIREKVRGAVCGGVCGFVDGSDQVSRAETVAKRTHGRDGVRQ